MSRHEAGGTLPPTLTSRNGDPAHTSTASIMAAQAGYHSVAGQPAAALQGTIGPLTLADFIDARVREIDAERLRLSMLREQVTSAGLVISVDDIRRVLG